MYLNGTVCKSEPECCSLQGVIYKVCLIIKSIVTSFLRCGHVLTPMQACVQE